MKIILARILAVVLCLSVAGYAQETHERSFKEEFNTNADVDIKVDTRYTDIVIEPWSKNSVQVEATIKVEGVSKESAERTIENWNFKALGNKSQVEITTREGNLLFSSYSVGSNEPLIFNSSGPLLNNVAIDLNNFESKNGLVFDTENLNTNTNHIIFNALSGNQIEMDSLKGFSFNYEFPNAAAIKALTAKIPEFDYEEFQKNQEYMVKWQEEMKKGMAEFKKAQEEMKKDLKYEVKLKAAANKERAELKKTLAKVNESNAAIRIKSKEIKALLEDREKIKVTKTIVIKAPKNAKFKLDAKYGTVSFSK